MRSAESDMNTKCARQAIAGPSFYCTLKEIGSANLIFKEYRQSVPSLQLPCFWKSLTSVVQPRRQGCNQASRTLDCNQIAMQRTALKIT
jgi:hypothetical protein